MVRSAILNFKNKKPSINTNQLKVVRFEITSIRVFKNVQKLIVKMRKPIF